MQLPSTTVFPPFACCTNTQDLVSVQTPLVCVPRPQTHVWSSANKATGGSAGVPVYSVCTARQLVAVAYNGADTAVHLMSTEDFQTLGVFKVSAHLAF